VPPRQGNCTRFGACDTADRHQLIILPDETDFVCPECRQLLTEVGFQQLRRPKGFMRGAAALLLLPALVLGWHEFSRKPPANAGAQYKVILRLAGSNTIGANMAPALAEAFFKGQGAKDVNIVVGATPEEKYVQGLLPSESVVSRIQISAHGSATAFTSLASGACDIGMASRQVKPDEATKLSSLGDMYSLANEHILGLDGIAVIVNQTNPLNALGKDQIMQIFSGELGDWSQVGSTRGPIRIYARDDKSGTFDTFRTLILGGKTLNPKAKRFEDSNALSEAVAGDPGGIGFIGLPYIQSAKALAVSEKGTRALQATPLTVATEDYPLSRRLYLYAPANPANRFTRKFIEFAMSKQGQDVVASSGFVAQNITPQQQVVAQEAPRDYKELTKSAERLSLNFRFRPGKSDLDNKAIVDMDRVVTFIANRHYTGDRILLFGFADSTGPPQVNRALALSRARTVEDQFKQRGLKPGAVQGFGSDLPVAANSTEDGRERNRRVEIWLKKGVAISIAK
jgi:phosphate transport system substrate-binding protein